MKYFLAITRGALLSDCNFYVVNVPIEFKSVDELNYGQGCYLGEYPCFESLECLGVVAPDHELVA